MRLLLAEDEAGIREAIGDVLEFNRYEITAVSNGIDALAYARREHFDGLLLDIMMPGMDGLTVLRTLRREGNAVPVLLLTARSEIEDRVQGLDAGADDYLPKPFAMKELLARIRAITRRPVLLSHRLNFGNLQLDEDACRLICHERSETLSRLEMDLISFLMQNKGMYFSADTLLDRVWGIDSNAQIGTVWVYISYLRKKLKSLQADVEICSRRGVGYALERSDP